MKLSSYVRAALAVVAWPTIALVYVACVLVAGVPLLLMRLFRWERGIDAIDRYSSFFLIIYEFVILRLCLKMTIKGREEEKKIAPIKPDEFVVCICNHPPMPTMLQAGAPIVRLVKRITALTKSEFRDKWYLAWFGRPVGFVGNFMFVRRRKKGEDKEKAKELALKMIEEGFMNARIGKNPRCIFVFVDKSRPDPKKIAADMKRTSIAAAEDIDPANYTDTHAPREAALWAYIEIAERLGIRDKMRVLEMVYGPDVTFWWIRHLPRLVGRTMIYTLREITETTRPWTCADDARSYLVERWPQVNKILRARRNA